MIIERLTSPELLDEHARVLGKDWQKYVNYGLGPVLLGGGIIVGARAKTGECIGLVWATRTKDPTTLSFCNIHVDTAYRRKGVAKLLEAQLCHLAVEDGVHWGLALAETWNTNADKFIRGQGWVFLGTVQNCYWRNDPTHLYFKDLLALDEEPPIDSAFWSMIYSLIKAEN
jgi:GNAT superfamily N-acetyltransferase